MNKNGKLYKLEPYSLYLRARGQHCYFWAVVMRLRHKDFVWIAIQWKINSQYLYCSHSSDHSVHMGVIPSLVHTKELSGDWQSLWLVMMVSIPSSFQP